MFRSIISVIGIAALSLACLAVAGCGTDEDTVDDISIHATTPAPPTPVTTPAPAEAPAVPETVVAEPALPVVVTYAEAEDAYLDRRYDDATELFARYTDRKPENPWGFYMLGLSAWKSGAFDQAEDAFARSLELDDRHVKSYLNLARVLLDGERPEEALAQIDAALTIDGESNTAFRLRGRACYQLGRIDDAKEAYRTALAIDDRDAWSMNNLALILIDEERFEDALPPLARAIELRDDVAVFWNNLGMALERTGHIREAEDAYAAAVAIDGSHARAFDNHERVAAVVAQPGVDRVDMSALAQEFADRLVPAVAEIDTIVEPTAVDSTSVTRNP